MSTYIVQPGMSITDVVLNSTGALIGPTNNWDTILTANGFDWVPDLIAGQVVQIPDAVVTVDQNALQQFKIYPAVNNFIDRWLDLIESIFALLLNNWILGINAGFWDDAGVWIDTDVWID